MITFNADGQEYRLEYTAYALKKMERDGMDFSELSNKIITSSEDLWCGLYIAHHPSVTRAKRLEHYHALKNVCDENEPRLDDRGEPIDELMEAIIDELTQATDKIKRGSGNLSWKRA